MSGFGHSGNDRFDLKTGFSPSSDLVQLTGFGPSSNAMVCNNVFSSSARFAWIVPQQGHVFVIENNGGM
jgi:hypothetical protein